MRTIMLVSDKAKDYSNFIEPLKLKYPVDAMGYVSTADIKLSFRPKEYTLIIIEINIMIYSEELELGDTGQIKSIIWYKKELASLGIPVLFWSYYDPHYCEEIKKLKHEYPNNKIDFLERNNFKEDSLLDGVEKFLNLKN